MFGRVVSTVRKKLNNRLNADSRKNSWHNLLKLHNERTLTMLSDFDRIHFKQAIDEREVNSCLLKVSQLATSVTVEDIATAFPTAVMIKLEKSRTNKTKTIYVGYEYEAEAIKAFVDCHRIQVKGRDIVVTFADIYFDRRSVTDLNDI